MLWLPPTYLNLSPIKLISYKNVFNDSITTLICSLENNIIISKKAIIFLRSPFCNDLSNVHQASPGIFEFGVAEYGVVCGIKSSSAPGFP
jgi:hypothetical protein